MVRLAGRIPSRSHFWIDFTETWIFAGELSGCLHSSLVSPVRVENQELAMAPKVPVISLYEIK